MKHALRLGLRAVGAVAAIAAVPAIALANPGAASGSTSGDILGAIGLNHVGFDFNTAVNFVTGPLALYAAAHGAHQAWEKAKQAQFDLKEMTNAGIGAAFGFIMLGGIGFAWNKWHNAATAAPLAFHHVAAHAHVLFH